jgi:prepilin signal peptidase PulO-like enzyme (type II secretory pathway)
MNLYQTVFLGLQNTEQIKEKMDNAPDKAYEIGVVIGTYLPFILFISFAYIVYYMFKKKKD